MATNDRDERPGRESRLLLLVVGVSVAVLFVLARLRFTGGDAPVVTPSAAPLAGLTARSALDEMSSTVADVLSRASDVVLVVELAPAPPAPQAGPARAAQKAPDEPKSSIWTPALRVAGDTAVLHVPNGWQPVSGFNLDAPLTLVAADPATETALVRVAVPGGEPRLPPAAALSTPSYVIAVSASPAGLGADPVFIGRTDTLTDPAWPRPLLRVFGHADLRAGEIVFTPDGSLIGLVAGSTEISRIVPLDTLRAVAQQLAAKGARP